MIGLGLVLLLSMGFIALATIILFVLFAKLGWAVLSSLGSAGILFLIGMVALFAARSERRHHSNHQIAIESPAVALPGPGEECEWNEFPGTPPGGPHPQLAISHHSPVGPHSHPPAAHPRFPPPASLPVPLEPAEVEAMASEPEQSKPQHGETGPETLHSTILEIVRNKEGDVTDERTLDAMPNWTQHSENVSTSGKTVVIHSQRFATETEARAQLWQQLRTRLVEKLGAEQPEIRRCFPKHDEGISRLVVRRDCISTSPITIGEFQESVKQVHWMIALDEASCRQVFAKLQPQLVNRRLQRVAVLFGVAVALLVIGALTKRARPASQTE